VNNSLIIAFVSDLYFSSRIEIVTRELGFSLRLYGSIKEIFISKEKEWVKQYAEHLVGQGADLLNIITKSQPVLIMFDLNNRNIPWEKWIALIKSAPATRRIPVIGYGSHMEVEKFKHAKSAGADLVLARSKFVSDLPQVLRKYALIKDVEALETSCRMSLAEDALKGIQEFNKGEFYKAHEYLERAWMEDSSEGRELYRAILQIAVAYLQIQRGNFRGTMKMFLRARQWIDPLPDTCRGVNVSKLRHDAYEVHKVISDLGIEGLSEFDSSLLKPIEYMN